MSLTEVQIDRIVGPSHHFGGLGVGNIASQSNEGSVSNPAAAAMQGLDKMRTVAMEGAVQLIVPPHRRPNLRFLRSLGFTGADETVLQSCYQQAPGLLSATMSCSAMWTANAATASASVDNADGKPSLTVANLSSSIHRDLESQETLVDLRHCLPFAHVAPALSGGAAMRDEGAANHMRLGSADETAGLHVFVVGDGEPRPKRFWPRQSRMSFEAIARAHKIPPENTFFLQQHPDAIDAGAFHNDVVAASHQGLLIHHQNAFANGPETLALIAERYDSIFKQPLNIIEVRETDLSLADSVATYLFNSQIISGDAPSAPPKILCPVHVKHDLAANKLVQNWCNEGVFSEVHFVDLGQSMRGGGGPACLRLRVPLTELEIRKIPQSCRWTEELDNKLRSVIQKHYPTKLSLADLATKDALKQIQTATTKIHQALQR